jgi:hypothetical protein
MPFFNLILRYLVDYTELIFNKMKFTQLLLVNAHAQFKNPSYVFGDETSGLLDRVMTSAS